MRLTRRSLLISALVPPVHGQKPEISAYDLSLLDAGSVANDLFFVRDHFGVPANVSRANWTLNCGSARLSYEELFAMPSRVIAATLECAENPVGGGLLGHAEWGGVPLTALLAKAGLPGRFVRLSGADGFSRCIPIAKAAHPDTLIVHSMNGEKLPLSHGFPLRAILPGWYGMDSVKWLNSIDLLENEDPPREFTRLSHSLLTGVRQDGAVRQLRVKSAFTRPADGAILHGRRFLLRGVAWGGVGRVKQVEVSVDGERIWLPAQLTVPATPFAWTHWILEWPIPGPGSYTLSVRATDQSGTRQPAERVPGRVDPYEWDSWQRLTVTAV